MATHGQFIVPHLVFVIAQTVQVMETLVGCGKYHTQVSIFLLGTEVEPVGSVLPCASCIVFQSSSTVAPRSHISEDSRYAIGRGIGFGFAQGAGVCGHVLVELLMAVISSWFVYSIYLRTVHSLPYTERCQTVVCRCSPCQFGCVNSFDACMACQ